LTVSLSQFSRCVGKGNHCETALRIEKAFEVKTDALLKMQTAWEIAQARKRQGSLICLGIWRLEQGIMSKVFAR
jgi:plasmid maintenance system antidote protein VapI